MDSLYDLQRFIQAQEAIYPSVLRELGQGRKRSHWMWFIFPQIQGLGSSAMAQKYAIASLLEARAYLEHPLLGPRLEECTQLVLDVEGRSIEQIFPYPDDLKFRSCMTLFDYCATDNPVFRKALEKYFKDGPDPLTLKILKI